MAARSRTAAGARSVAEPDDGSAAQATVAEAVAGALASAGVELAFTFPGGGSNLALLDALQARSVRTVLTRSEVGGGLMASTVADITGRPSALIVGLGPGAASAMNGVAHAWLDRSPVVLIADRYSDADAATTGHQVLDQRAMYAPVTKAYVSATPDDVAGAMQRALELALEPPRGPVFVEMRRDHARMPSVPAMRPAGTLSTSAGDAASASDRAAAARLIAAARKPIILVGDEARRDLDPALIVALAERLRAPVLSSYKGKGVFPERHPLAAGIVTGAEIERPLLAEADVLLGVGLDPVELLARSWPYDADVVALRLADAADSYLDPRVTLTGPLEASLGALSRDVGDVMSEWSDGDAAVRGARMRDSLRATGGPLSVWRAVEVAQEIAGDAVVTVDAGAHMFAATWFWQSNRPNRFHISNGLATMGFAVPAAIGAALAQPGETVIAFTGDGGFTINAAELETAARAGANVVVVVLNDASLSLIRVKQDDIGLTRSNVDFVRSDFASVARGLGAHGARAATEDELRSALAAALAKSGPALVDVEIAGTEYAQIHGRIRNAR
jgi:acetolactate synthase I/II/III large subunit